jgi:hypothetical protein
MVLSPRRTGEGGCSPFALGYTILRLLGWDVQEKAAYEERGRRIVLLRTELFSSRLRKKCFERSKLKGIFHP